MSNASLPYCMMPDGGEACIAYREAVATIERLTRERDEARERAERSTRRLVEATAPGSIGAFAGRDAWKDRALAAEAREAKLREADPVALELAERLDQYYCATDLSYDNARLLRRVVSCLRRLGDVK